MNTALRRQLAKRWFNIGRQITFLRKLESLLNAGVSTARALEQLHDRASEGGRRPHALMAVALAEWKNQYARGVGLSQALKGWVPDPVISSLRASEEGASETVSLGGAIKNLNFAATVHATLMSVYGVFAGYLVLMFVTIVIYSNEIIPVFSQINDSALWTGYAGQMAWIADNLWLVLGTVTLLVMVFVRTIRFLLPRWSGRSRTVVEQLPGFSLYRLSVGCAFMDALVGMLDAGKKVPDAVGTLARTANPYLRERLVKAKRALDAGRNLGEAFHSTGYGFPDPELVLDLRDFADVGDHQILRKIVSDWRRQGLKQIKRDGKIINGLSGGMFILFTVWLIYATFEIQDQMQNSIGF